MNKTKIITICCLAVTALLLVGVALAVVGFGGESFTVASGYMAEGMRIDRITHPRGTLAEQNTEELDAADVDGLTVDWVAGDVEIFPYDGSRVKLVEYAGSTLTGEESFSVTTDGDGVLRVRFIAGQHLRSCPEKKLEIYIPQNLAERLGDLSVSNSMGNISAESLAGQALQMDTFSGKITVEALTAEGLTLSTSSGQIELTDITVSSALRCETFSGGIQVSALSAAEIGLSTSSGAVKLDDVQLDTAEIETFSGGIKVSGLEGDTLTVSTSSGGIRLSGSTVRLVEGDSFSGGINLEGAFEQVVCDTSSGSVTVESSRQLERFAADTFSGGVTLTVPGDREVTVSFDTFSGGFTSDIPVIQTDSGADYTVSTSSGGFRIKGL